MTTPQRTLDRLRHHYEVERELAARLRSSTREERPALFGKLYDELFERVPDHPRLTRRVSPEESQQKVAGQLRLLGPFLEPEGKLVEFAPGDCRLAYAACSKVDSVLAVDISDQRTPQDQVSAPRNFSLVVYDGFDLDLPDGMADLAFSYQFLEHLHPDDLGPHLNLVHRLLKPGGVYVFDTPHRYSGPHDVSRHFSDSLDCFHFREWTHREMRAVLKRHGFQRSGFIRGRRFWASGSFNAMLDFVEWVLVPLPHRLRRRVFSRVFPSVAMGAIRS